jgi:hypothetical protein
MSTITPVYKHLFDLGVGQNLRLFDRLGQGVTILLVNTLDGVVPLKAHRKIHSS